MKKKNIKYLFALVFALIATVSLNACGSDEANKTDATPNIEPTIVADEMEVQSNERPELAKLMKQEKEKRKSINAFLEEKGISSSLQMLVSNMTRENECPLRVSEFLKRMGFAIVKDGDSKLRAVGAGGREIEITEYSDYMNFSFCSPGLSIDPYVMRVAQPSAEIEMRIGLSLDATEGNIDEDSKRYLYDDLINVLGLATLFNEYDPNMKDFDGEVFDYSRLGAYGDKLMLNGKEYHEYREAFSGLFSYVLCLNEETNSLQREGSNLLHGVFSCEGMKYGEDRVKNHELEAKGNYEKLSIEKTFDHVGHKYIVKVEGFARGDKTVFDFSLSRDGEKIIRHSCPILNENSDLSSAIFLRIVDGTNFEDCGLDDYPDGIPGIVIAIEKSDYEELMREFFAATNYELNSVYVTQSELDEAFSA